MTDLRSSGLPALHRARPGVEPAPVGGPERLAVGAAAHRRVVHRRAHRQDRRAQEPLQLTGTGRASDRFRSAEIADEWNESLRVVQLQRRQCLIGKVFHFVKNVATFMLLKSEAMLISRYSLF